MTFLFKFSCFNNIDKKQKNKKKNKKQKKKLIIHAIKNIEKIM